MLVNAAASVLALASMAHAYGYVVSNPNGPFPDHTESGQYGTNNCVTDSPSANCQTLHVNNAGDFCLWAPHSSSTVGDAEASVISYCVKAGHGSRIMPAGTLKNVHVQKTSRYIQIVGTGDFTKIGIKKGDEGGELDPHGADGNGNPHGALVISNARGANEQILEWTQFISYNQFCIRACYKQAGDASWCNHIYDVMGCEWNMPANYNSGVDTCDAATPAQPMGVYNKNGKLSTFHQGTGPTPAAQNPPKSSNCVKTSIVYGAYGKAAAKTTTTKMVTTTKAAAVKKTTTIKKKTTTKKTTKKTTTKKTTTKKATTTTKALLAKLTKL